MSKTRKIIFFNFVPWLRQCACFESNHCVPLRGLDIRWECRFNDFRFALLPQVLRHRARRSAKQGLHTQGLGRLHPQAQDGTAKEEDHRGKDEVARGHKQETVAQNPGTCEATPPCTPFDVAPFDVGVHSRYSSCNSSYRFISLRNTRPR